MAVGGLRLEAISLRSEVGSRGSEGRGHRSGARGQKSKVWNQRARAGGSGVSVKCLVHKKDELRRICRTEVIISPISFQVRQDLLFQDPLETLQL